ncbi:MAG: heme d1 biosynthesis radical SAM protein NirJ [Parahaliea sp.]
MFRISAMMKELVAPSEVKEYRNPPGPVVIWNLVRQCNLGCKHCYASSVDKVFSGELSTEEVYAVMEDLKQARVPVLILSGGEPLLRPDIFDISHRAKTMGFYTALSSNGTLITDDNIDQIAAVNYDYVGVSIDGIGAVNDAFRMKEGAYEAALNGLRLCRERNLKIGLRFTLTEDNAEQFPHIMKLLDEECIDKFYLSHLNYAGRGNNNRGDDAYFQHTRKVMDKLFELCWDNLNKGRELEVTTGNNDADGVYMLHWVRRHFPDRADHFQRKLMQWGGNASGQNVANIDNRGNVHPDTMWWHYKLGNVKERAFGDIWQDTSDPLMAGLKQRPRPVKGRCAQCDYLNICNGNTRCRAHRLSKDFWAEDPGCYLLDKELGIREPDCIVAM